MKNIFILIAIILFSISCKKGNQPDVETEELVTTQEEVNISSIGITLSETANQEMKKWSKYQLLVSKIERYNKVTKSDALLNAAELATLIYEEFDTIDVKKLDRPDVKMRFNVLNNHAYRLQDMATIPSITEEEVKYEVTQLLNAFSSLNDKINVVYKIDEYKNQYESELSDTIKFFEPEKIEEGQAQKKRLVEKQPNSISSKEKKEVLKLNKKTTPKGSLQKQ